MSADYLDNSTEAKARRNVLVASGVTFLLANLRIESNTLELLSLRFIVEPERLVAVGQLICGLLLLIFLLRSFPRMIEALKDIWTKWYAGRENRELMSLQFHIFGPNGDEYDGSPESEFRDAQSSFAAKRDQVQNRFDFFQRFFSAVAVLSVDFLFPLSFGLLAVFRPYSVSNYFVPLAQSLQQ